MENRQELESMLPFLPVLLRSSSLFWPPPAVEALKALARGPDHSKVDSGEVLFLAISDIRLSLNLAADRLAASAAHGYALFFDDLITRADAAKFFGEVVPALAKLLLRFPSLLETHYENVGGVIDYGGRNGVKTFLRLLESQESGIVFLSQFVAVAFRNDNGVSIWIPAGNGEFSRLLHVIRMCLHKLGKQAI
ncbi:hypothetical protein RJ640_018046 [Escallonia rubra]|uniref:PARG helical domain-containing protein n=1 Tax=Escallonia rubra TaxID=112253 RepID=A0AA88R2H9_9ASTE|nr:hypothetical protein RJ640_018046 [Escallonia rubra]